MRQAYVGYGLLGNREFVEKILGRKLSILEGPVTLQGFQLRIIERAEFPQSIQEKTREGFRIYGLAEALDSTKMVFGMQLRVSEEEQAVIDALNFGDELYTPHGVTFDTGAQARVDLLQNQRLGLPVADGLNYEHFLNGREVSLGIATVLNDQFLRPFLEGSPPRPESRG